MFLFSKNNLRRLATIFLASVTLLIGTVFANNTPAIAAEAITRDATNLNTVDVVSEQEYELDKAQRQQEQAMRSEMATPDQSDESIVEKLNLNEGLPRSTKKFAEQITGDEPINNETRP